MERSLGNHETAPTPARVKPVWFPGDLAVGRDKPSQPARCELNGHSRDPALRKATPSCQKRNAQRDEDCGQERVILPDFVARDRQQSRCGQFGLLR